MNVSFPKLPVPSVLAIYCCASSLFAQISPAADPIPSSPTPPQAALSGQDLIEAAAQKLKTYRTVESKLRVRTDLLGQPLVGTGSYAQLESTSGLLLRMELSIQAGQEVTSVKQISNGRSLWEHWRIGKSERVKHIDLNRVARTLRQHPVPLSMNSSSLASGGLPRLTTQLAVNFDFSTQPVRSGKLGDVDVFAVVGIWKADRLSATAPGAVTGTQVVLDKLPAHLPHQVELFIGKADLFPYRVTYQKWEGAEQPRLVPVVTTEFFEVTIDSVLDATQFHYERPANVQDVDQTDLFLQSLGVATKTTVETTR